MMAAADVPRFVEAALGPPQDRPMRQKYKTICLPGKDCAILAETCAEMTAGLKIRQLYALPTSAGAVFGVIDPVCVFRTMPTAVVKTSETMEKLIEKTEQAAMIASELPPDASADDRFAVACNYLAFEVLLIWPAARACLEIARCCVPGQTPVLVLGSDRVNLTARVRSAVPPEMGPRSAPTDVLCAVQLADRLAWFWLPVRWADLPTATGIPGKMLLPGQHPGSRGMLCTARTLDFFRTMDAYRDCCAERLARMFAANTEPPSDDLSGTDSDWSDDDTAP